MKHFLSEEYRILGTNMYNWTKYSRENIPKPPPKFKVGDRVKFTIETEVTEIGKDCDGTTLYGLDMLGYGWDEEKLSSL